MSLPEVIPSNLPVFTRKTPRSAFANSVIPEGSVLLFAESDSKGGTRLVQKDSNGTYSETGGGGSMKFYKCASVDSDSGWTGKLATIDSTTGIWSFASDSTSSLTYDRIKPVVGKVYDEDCTFQVRRYKTLIPEDGIVFYASLDGTNTGEAESGQTIHSSGTVLYETKNGVKCAYNEYDDSYLYATDTGFPSGNSQRTFSFWLYLSQITQDDWNYFIQYGPWGDGSNYQLFAIAIREGNKIGVDGYYSTNIDTGTTLLAQRWYHIAISYDGSQLVFYVNGTQSSTVTNSQLSTQLTGTFQIFVQSHFPTAPGTRLAAVRVYNRVLASTQIADLAKEFTPTSA